MARRAPTPSKHAKYDRWPSRSATPGVDIREAWRDANPIEITYRENGHGTIPRHDEARYHPPSGTVIFRRDSSLVTVYDVTKTGVSNEFGRAARLSVIDEYGIPEQHPDYQDQ